MFRTLALSGLTLAVAAGAPVVYYNASSLLKSQPAATAGKTGAEKQAAPGGGAAPGEAAPLEGPRATDLAEIFRFDVTPAWVLGRWPRVSTGMGQLQLQGYRVTLVTGTEEADLAGALTYFFNPHQQLQRIAFYGTTGNPQKLVQLLTAKFGFARRIVNDPGMFVWEAPSAESATPSVLQMQSADVIKQSEAYRRFKLSLVLERPGA